MAYTLDFDICDGYTLSVTRGTITSFEEYARKSLAVVKNCLDVGILRTLLDERELDVSLDAYDISQMPDLFLPDGVQTLGGRLACLYNPACEGVYRQLETVYRNRSFSYRIFEDEDAARAWLVS